MHKLNTGVLPPTYAFLFRSLSTLQVHHLHLELLFRHFVEDTQYRVFIVSLTITPWPIYPVRGFAGTLLTYGRELSRSHASIGCLLLRRLVGGLCNPNCTRGCYRCYSIFIFLRNFGLSHK
jgi:hypothetical protein